MDDFVRLIVYGAIALAWLVLSARRAGKGDEQHPWEELPPLPRRPMPPAPTKPAPPRDSTPKRPVTVITANGRRIVVRPPKSNSPTAAPTPATAMRARPTPSADLVEAVQALAADRAYAPTTSIPSAPAPAAEPLWSIPLDSPKEIAEGMLLSAILGPPKASAYLRRITPYRC